MKSKRQNIRSGDNPFFFQASPSLDTVVFLSKSKNSNEENYHQDCVNKRIDGDST